MPPIIGRKMARSTTKSPAFADWATILPGVDEILPLGDDPDFRWSPRALVRQVFFDLDELPAALARREPGPAPVWVHVDVLRIGTALEFDAPELILHARRIEVSAAAAITLRSGEASAPACRLALRADEWAFEAIDGRLPIVVGGVRHDLPAQPPGGGLDALVGADGSVSLEETGEQRLGDPLSGQMALDAARRLVHSPDPLAKDAKAERERTRELPFRIADWVARTGGDALLRADAHAFARRLRVLDRDRFAVPVLRLAQYDALAKETQAALAEVERAYREHFQRGRDLADQWHEAEQMLGHYRHAKAYADKLLAQAADDMAQAQQAVEQARALLASRRDEVQTCQAAFEAGVKAKEGELKRQSVFDVLGAVIEVGASVAAIVASGGAAAPVAGPAVADAAAKGAKAASRIKKLLELLKTIQKVLQVIAKLAACAIKIKGIHDALDRPAQARKRAEQASDALPDPLDPAEQMSAADWDEFALGLDTLFAQAIELEIAGAADFLLALKKMAVRGRDLVATQSALDRSVHDLQQRLWQSLRDEADIADMQARIESIGAERGPGSVLMTYYAQLRDRLKFRLINAIDRMREAYRYETLAEPRWQPSFRLAGAELATILADQQEALLRAKEARQALGSWRDYLIEDDPAVLDALRRRGTLSWVIDLGNFADYDRVRIDEIRVWLRGELGRARRLIDISTSGQYADRLGAKRLDFDTRRLQRSFSYEPWTRGTDEDCWGDPVRLLHRANDSAGDYFQPTAFTTWTIELPPSRRAALDLSGLRAIAIEFFGTAVRAAPTRLAALRGSAPRGEPPRLLRKVVVL